MDRFTLKMLVLHFLNVDHGDCVILEFHNNGTRHFGLIDSNATGPGAPKALTKLQQLGAAELAFVCLTHPHKDHYTGLAEVLNAFQGHVRQLYFFPIGGFITNAKRLKGLAKIYQDLRNKQANAGIRRGLQEFLEILKFAMGMNKDDCFECGGERNQIAPPGYDPIKMYTILPPLRVKGDYIQRIERGDPSGVETEAENAMSIALQLEYAGHTIVLGGDGTYENWLLHSRWEERAKTNIKSAVVKLPHHGSRTDCAPDVLEQLFHDNGFRVAVISANGRSHPHEDVIGWLSQHQVQPYCTNLIPQCGAKVTRLVTGTNVDPVLRQWLNDMSTHTDHVQVCQGDVTVVVNPNGTVTATPEFQHLCPYRPSINGIFKPQQQAQAVI